MNEFILIFRMDILSPEAQPDAAQMAVYMQQWEKWISSLAAGNKLAPGGNHLSKAGKVLKPNGVVLHGPHATNRESVAGYILILATNLEEAAALAMDCPILKGEGTSVEVRQVER